MKRHWQNSNFMNWHKILNPKQINFISYYYHKLMSKFIDRYEVEHPNHSYNLDKTQTNLMKDVLLETTGIYKEQGDSFVLNKSFGNFYQDSDGNQILDMSMSDGFNVLGYSPRTIVSKTKLELFQQGKVNSFNETGCLDYVDDLRELHKLAPINCESIQLTEDDEEAIVQALRLACLSNMNNQNQNNSFKILTFNGGNFQPQFAVELPFPEINHPYSENSTTNHSNENKCLENIIRKVRELKNEGQNIPALVIEPIQYKAGVRYTSPLFYRKLQQICKENDIKFIIDETYTCGWVTGRLFAHYNWCTELSPDIVVFGGRMQVSGFFHKPDLVSEDLPLKLKAKPDISKLTYLLQLKDEVYKKNWHDLHATDFISSIKTEFNEIKRNSYFEIKNLRGVGKMFAFDVDHRLLRDEIVFLSRNKGFKVGISGDTTIVFTPSLVFTEVHFTFYKNFLMSLKPATQYMPRI